jgi:hypothetical protein
VRHFGLGLALAVLAAAVLAWSGEGFPPATLAGRRWLAQLPPGWSWSELGVGVPRFVRDWFGALSAQFAFGNLVPFLPEGWAEPMRAPRLLAKLVLGLLVLDGLGQALRWSRRRAESSALRLFVIWSTWTFVQYCVLLPDRGHAGRYQPQILLGVLVFGGIALRHLGWRRWPRPFLALFVLGVLVGSVTTVRLTALASAHLAAVHRRAVAELPRWIGPEDQVAAFDIGILAYEGRVAWLDLSGLCDRELWPAVQSRSTAFYLRDRGATHVLLPLTESDGPGSLRDRLRLSDLDDTALTPLCEWSSLDRRWGAAFGFSGNAARRLVLYALP